MYSQKSTLKGKIIISGYQILPYECLKPFPFRKFVFIEPYSRYSSNDGKEMIDDLISHVSETLAMKDLLNKYSKDKTNFKERRLQVSSHEFY